MSKKKKKMGKAQKWKIEKRIQLERGEFGTLIASCNKSAGAVINIDFEIVPLHDACMCGVCGCASVCDCECDVATPPSTHFT